MAIAANTRVGLMAATFAASMVGAAYAAVPLYRLFCQATGFQGTTQRAEQAPGAVAGRTVSVRFDGNVNGIPWTFGPDKNSETVKLGEKRIAFFRATNNSDVPVTGAASYNVSPETAGAYFSKIQCFCFTEQTLQPHQTVEMPVVYFVNPDLVKDPDANRIEEITLSYTFYPVDKPQAAGQKASQTAQPKQG